MPHSVDSQKDLERRRLPRLALERDQFRLQENGKLFSLADLSQGGMAFRLLEASDLYLFPVGRQIAGVLSLRGKKVSVQARVQHVRQDRVGVEWVNLVEDSVRQLEDFLAPSQLGQELTALPGAEDGTQVWYHGRFGTELLLGLGSHSAAFGGLRQWSLYILGYYVGWEQTLGLQTGVVQPSTHCAEIHGAFLRESLLVQPDQRPDPYKLDIAKQLILGSNLPQELKQGCVQSLQEA